MINGIDGAGFMDFTRMTEMRGEVGNPFEKIDSNGDGELDKVELSSLAKKISEMTGQSVDVDQLISKLDGDKDGLVSEKEFEAGRPQGPLPGTMGLMGAMKPGGMEGGGTHSLLNKLNGSEDEDVSSWLDPLDTNGDGIVDAEEAKAGINYLIQKYQSQMTITSDQDDETSGQLKLLG
jgi:Ca2+-binding EF-hand superfamily protein